MGGNVLRLTWVIIPAATIVVVAAAPVATPVAAILPVGAGRAFGDQRIVAGRAPPSTP